MSGPSGADFDLLAREHMARQVQGAAAVQVAIGRLWERYVDPNDLDGTFPEFERQARRVVTGGRGISERTASNYYASFRTLAGLEGPGPLVTAQPGDEIATARALYSNGYGYLKRRTAEGVDPLEALGGARTQVLGAVKSRSLAAGRQRLADLGAADPDVHGWARVSDGKPCAFCAMLIGRGPVYRAQTVGFRAHNACGCNVRLVPAKRGLDPADGWGEDALAFAKIIAHVGLDLVAYRVAYSASLADPTSGVAKAVAAVAAGAATSSALRASALALAA